MSNTITITNRGDSSQSIGETNKLIARIAVLEDRLTKLTDKSSKQADMMGKGYASAEAKVKHFEKALKDASNVRMKFAAIEGLQAASQEFKIAKNDFERSMQMSHAQSTGIDAQIQATKLLRAERDNDWNAVSSQLHAEKSLRDDIIARSNAQYATQQQLNREMAVASQVTANMARDNRANAAALQAFDAKQLRQSMEANGRVHQRDMIGRLSAWQSQSLPSSMAASMSAAATEDKLRRAQADREKQDIVGRLTAYQQQPKPLTMTGAMGMAALEDQKQREQSKIAQRAQAMLDRDAGVAQRRQEIDMRVARARELDAKYALRASDEKSYANSRPGVEIFNSESTIKARRALLLERKNNLPSEGDDFQKTITELREIDKLLKRINAKPLKAVELGSPKALRQQIKYLEAEMAKIGAGPQWDKLNAKLASAKTQLGGMQQKSRDAEKALSQAATAPMGSWVRLEYELEQAKKELSLLTYGTKEFIAQQAKVAGLQKDWDNVNSAINRTNKTQKDGNSIIMSAIGQVKTLAATYIGIHQVMTQITSEWEKQRAFELDANKKGIGIEAEMVKQAANVGAENLPQVQRWARANQPDLLAKQADIIGLVGAAISSGEPDIQRAMKVTAAALKINVGDVQMANEMLQGGITIGRLNNSDNFESAFGQLRSSSKVSQAVDESEFIGNVTGKMAALTRGRKNLDGMTTERALEFITSASRIQVDRTGESSSTNMAAIFQRMDEFAPVAKKVLKDRTVSRIDQKSIDAFKAARSFDEKLEMLRSNKAMGEQFIDKQRTGGPKELAFALVQNSQSTRNIMKEAADAVLPFKDAGIAFRQAVTDVNKAVPNLIVSRQMEAGQEQARTGSETQLKASARAVWDSVWNASADGTAPVNLSGLDVVERATSWTDRASWASQRKTGALKDGGNEITDMVKSLKDIQTRNKDAGNMDAARSLDAQLKALQTIAEKLDELNAQVAAGRQGHHAVPQRAAQAVRVPPVPRVPIAAGSLKSGDPFGMRKR